MPGVTDITVLKRNLDGEVTWQYEGRVLQREANCVVLEAFFNRDDMPFMDVVSEARRPFCGNVLFGPLV
jgi:hypothetical protein